MALPHDHARAAQREVASAQWLSLVVATTKRPKPVAHVTHGQRRCRRRRHPRCRAHHHFAAPSSPRQSLLKAVCTIARSGPQPGADCRDPTGRGEKPDGRVAGRHAASPPHERASAHGGHEQGDLHRVVRPPPGPPAACRPAHDHELTGVLGHSLRRGRPQPHSCVPWAACGLAVEAGSGAGATCCWSAAGGPWPFNHRLPSWLHHPPSRAGHRPWDMQTRGGVLLQARGAVWCWGYAEGYGVQARRGPGPHRWLAHCGAPSVQPVDRPPGTTEGGARELDQSVEGTCGSQVDVC